MGYQCDNIGLDNNLGIDDCLQKCEDHHDDHDDLDDQECDQYYNCGNNQFCNFRFGDYGHCESCVVPARTSLLCDQPQILVPSNVGGYSCLVNGVSNGQHSRDGISTSATCARSGG